MTTKNWYGGTQTTKYRTLTVTETTETYRYNKPIGETTKKSYTTTEIIKQYAVTVNFDTNLNSTINLFFY